MKLKFIGFLMIGLTGYFQTEAQILDYENKIEVVLSDNTPVTLYGTAMSGGRISNEYYYLPPSQSLRVTKRGDGTPEFLYMKYTTDEKTDAGGVQGAILHFLMEFGLTQTELQELNDLVSEDHNGSVKGQVDLSSSVENSFAIISGSINQEQNTIITSGTAPVVSGSKAAVAANLEKYSAQIFAATLEDTRSIADLSLEMNYQYSLLAPAARGKIECNWQRLETVSESFIDNFINREMDNDINATQGIKKTMSQLKDPCGSGSASPMRELMKAAAVAEETYGDYKQGGEWYISQNSMSKIYSYLQDTEIIKMEWDENIDDERIDVIREAFFDYFLNGFTDMAPPLPTKSRDDFSDRPDREKINEEVQNTSSAETIIYQGSDCSQFTNFMNRTKIIRLDNIRLSVKRPLRLTSNIASEYDHVKDNPKCVGSVNLADPFYQHREIYAILDLDTRDLFDKEINYATVSIRKKRPNAPDFEKAFVFNSDQIEKFGTQRSTTYSRGDDKGDDPYEYKSSWSLRGGLEFGDENWNEGTWGSAITLSPPVIRRNIEAEADIEELIENRIARVTVQVRYIKFGKEYEKNVHISPAKKEPLVEEQIFVDRDSKGYAYRLILNHKDHGKLVLPWEEKTNDNYIYAVISKEVIAGERSFIEKAKAAASEMEDFNGKIVDPVLRILKDSGLLKLFSK